MMLAKIGVMRGAAPRRRARVQVPSQGDALGQAEVEAGSIAAAVIRSKFTASPQAGFWGSASSPIGLLRTCSQARKSSSQKEPAIGDGSQSGRKRQQSKSIRGSVMCRNSHRTRKTPRIARHGTEAPPALLFDMFSALWSWRESRKT
jgi:hypothetical protein